MNNPRSAKAQGSPECTEVERGGAEPLEKLIQLWQRSDSSRGKLLLNTHLARPQAVVFKLTQHGKQ